MEVSDKQIHHPLVFQLFVWLFFSIVLAGCSDSTETNHANNTVSASHEKISDYRILSLKTKLSSGTPHDKEEVLNLFMKEHFVELVPSVIDAILDDTASPRHGDTGWARIHHQAATAMCKFAYRFDGKSQKERGRDKYSFFNDGGIGTEARRREVHRNWVKWWKENEEYVANASVEGLH